MDGDIPEVMPAGKLVVGPTQMRIALGSSEVLRLLTTGSAGAFAKAAFKLRIFRVNDRYSHPGAWASFQVGNDDWCDVLLSNVVDYSQGATISDSLPLPNFTDHSWLTLTGSNLERAHYLVVFERSSDTEPLLRLRRSHAQRYFGAALRLEIVPVGSYSETEIEAVRKHVATSRVKFARAALENTASLRCYRLQRATATPQAQDESFALLGDCEGSVDVDASVDIQAF